MRTTRWSGGHGGAGLWALALVLAVLMGAALPSRAPGAEVYGRSAADLGLYLGNSLLSAWRVGEARELVERLRAESPEAADGVLALEAHVLFFEGRYRESLQVLDQLEVSGPFRDLVQATAEAATGFRSASSEHFEVSWSNPKDEVMVQDALVTLEAARGAIAAELGFSPDDRLRVEIYPSVASFTSVSTLTRDEVETSGTIGLCKFNRIMITSPRVTSWGYRWRDTLSHEYIHLALYRLSDGTAPIWIHEGVAKYLEASWRGAKGEMEPAGEALLARRLEAGTLISLEQMSPSVAKLPSAEDTALAFAEVGTMMAFLVETRGEGSLRGLVEALGEGLDDRSALERVWGDAFETFDRGWRDWAAALPLRSDSVQVIGMELGEKGEEDAPGVIPDPRAQDFARLGDLLRARGRDAAAAAEYEKAYRRAPAAPGIASRQVYGLIAVERFEEAAQVAGEALQLYPDLAVLWYRMGEALSRLGRLEEALETWQVVPEINPFHIPARAAMLAAARDLGDGSEAERQEWALGVLQSDGHGGEGGR